MKNYFYPLCPLWRGGDGKGQLIDGSMCCVFRGRIHEDLLLRKYSELAKQIFRIGKGAMYSKLSKKGGKEGKPALLMLLLT